MTPTSKQLKFLGIPGVPPPVDILLDGSIYAAVLDSVPAHLSIIIQALRSNISAGNTCVLVTQMTPDVFLSKTGVSGADFSEDIKQNRLYLFSQEGDYTSNIFRYGVKRFLREFEYFGVPKESFFLIDQANNLFTMSDRNIAQMQAIDYRDWMKSTGSTSLFLFHERGEEISQAVLNCFNGIARVNQSKTGIELLVDYWYSQDGAIAAKAFPVLLDSSGLIRVAPSLPPAASETDQAGSSADDLSSVYYFGPDFEAFSASIPHTGNWIHVQSFVDLIHLSRDAVSATVVISLNSHSDLVKIAKIVHYLRLNQGNSLRIIIRESNFSLRYLNELLLLRLGVNLIIHQHIAKQQLPLLWEILAGQTYTRRLNKNFDLTLSSILPSIYKGYVDLASFCNESLAMLERGNILDIPFTLIIAGYHGEASPPDILRQIKVVRNGDIFSSDSSHCYIFIHACSEENSADALSRITDYKQASLFSNTRFINTRESIRETLQHLAQSEHNAFAPDFSEAGTTLSPASITKPSNPDVLPVSEESPDNLAFLMNMRPHQAAVTESKLWSRK